MKATFKEFTGVIEYHKYGFEEEETPVMLFDGVHNVHRLDHLKNDFNVVVHHVDNNGRVTERYGIRVDSKSKVYVNYEVK